MAHDNVRKVAITAMVAGLGILLVCGYLVMRGDSAAEDQGLTGPDAFVPYEGSEAEEEPLVEEPVVDKPVVDERAPKGGLRNLVPDDEQFGPAGGDTGPHRVTITVRSDGAIYVGYRFWKAGEGLKFAEGRFSMTKTVNRGRAVAQVGAQILDTATYATCTISVDGVLVNTYTAKKKLNVAICAA